MDTVVDRPDVALVKRDVAGVVPLIADLAPAFDGASVLVTGGGGMIGGYACDLLVGLNDSGTLRSPLRLVVATRRRPQGTDRLAHLAGRPDVEVIVPGPSGDWDIPTGIDYVIYAASPASPAQYLADPVGTLDANSRHLRTALAAAARDPARGFVYLSTSEVYGNPPPDAIPTAETFIGATDPVAERAS